MKTLKLFLLISSIVYSTVASGLQVSGVSIDETIVLGPGKSKLVLQGAGVRSKLFIDVYVGALYTKKPVSTPEQAVAQAGAKRMQMIFLYDGVTQSKLQKTWLEGIKANNSRNDYQKFEKQIEWFVSLFDQNMKPGDKVVIDYIPALGTKVEINGEEKGRVIDKGFYPLVLNTWMGNKPPSKKFRKELLTFEG